MNKLQGGLFIVIKKVHTPRKTHEFSSNTFWTINKLKKEKKKKKNPFLDDLGGYGQLLKIMV